MTNLLDQALEQFLRASLKKFEDRLRQAGLVEENVKNRVRGARQFVAYLFGRYRGKHKRT